MLSNKFSIVCKWIVYLDWICLEKPGLVNDRRILIGSALLLIFDQRRTNVVLSFFLSLWQQTLAPKSATKYEQAHFHAQYSRKWARSQANKAVAYLTHKYGRTSVYSIYSFVWHSPTVLRPSHYADRA